MSDLYTIRPLTPERIDEAFPVIAVLDPGITPAEWADYAATLLAPSDPRHGNGILTVQDPQGRIIGISVYRIRPDLRRGRILDIENFAVVNLIKPQHAASALLKALEDLARERECECLSISLLNPKSRRTLREPGSRPSDLFRGAGFRADLARLRKCLDEDPAAGAAPGGTASSGGRPPGPRLGLVEP